MSKELCRKFFRAHIQENGGDIDKVLTRDFVNVSLLLTNDCNLSCPYCYQPKGFRSKATMPTEIADKAMQFSCRTFTGRRLITTLFGGEPFLQRDLLMHIVNKYQMCRFVVTTNGKILVENEDIRNWVVKSRHNLTVSFSITALKPIYGDQLMDKVLPVLGVVKSNQGDVHYVVEDPFDINVVEHIEYLLDFEIPQLRISVPKESKNTVLWQDQYIKLFRELADIIYKRPNRKTKMGWDAAFTSNINKVTRGKEITSYPSSYCGAGFNYIAIDSKGDIYPCDYFAAYPDYKIGDIFNGFTSKLRVFSHRPEWYNEIYEHCDKCPIGDVLLCPNPMCMAENLKHNNDILNPTDVNCACRRVEYETYKYISQMDLKHDSTEEGVIQPC